MNAMKRDFHVAGLDEAGRGALAGPMVAAVAVLPLPISELEKKAKTPVRDSKTLSENQREAVFAAICSLSLPFQTEVVSVSEINKQGIGWTNKDVMVRLMRRLVAEEYIIDGNMKISCPWKDAIAKSVVDADATIGSVIIAGIIAKVTRDHIMHELHPNYPMYGWNQNKGYGTLQHRTMIQKYGICPEHRLLFVRKCTAI